MPCTDCLTWIPLFALKHNLYILEDNAECFTLQRVNWWDRLATVLALVSEFWHLSSGEGGIVLTNNEELADNIRRVQSLGYAGLAAKKSKISKSDIQSPYYSRHTSMGWNYRMPELCSAVALAQTENIHQLVDMRKQSAQLMLDAIADFSSWFVPQYTPNHCINSYWTLAVSNKHSDVGWHDFYDLFTANGGDGFYGAWKLTYLEPMFENLNLLGRDQFISASRLSEYQLGLCPNAEMIQPTIMQFKTNYYSLDEIKGQAEILHSTLLQIA